MLFFFFFPTDLVGDYAAQVEWGKRHWLDFDLVRTVRNGAIGAMFGPLVSVRIDTSTRHDSSVVTRTR
jgi:hypothetical protein